MTQSLYYKLWVYDDSAGSWVSIDNFWNLEFTRQLGGSGMISFKTTLTGDWESLIRGAENENREIKVTHRYEIDADSDTVTDTEVSDPTAAQGAGNVVIDVDDFVIREVNDDVVGEEEVNVRGATFEQLLKDLSVPERVYYEDVTAHKIVTTGTDSKPPYDGEIDSSNIDSNPGLVELKRGVNNSFDAVTAGDIGTSTTNVGETVTHHVEAEQYYSAFTRLNDKAGTYIRASRAAHKTVQIDFYDRVEGGNLTRHYTPGTRDPSTNNTKTEGLILTEDGEDLPDSLQLSLGVHVQNLQKTSDKEPKADKTYVVGGSDSGYQKVGESSASGSTPFKEELHYFPEATDQGTVDQMATQIQDVWDSAEQGQRYTMVVFNSFLYSPSFQAELGDIVGVSDYDNQEFRGKFVRYRYSQNSEMHDFEMAFTGTNVGQKIAAIEREAQENIKNKQRRSNWTAPGSRGGNAGPNSPLTFGPVEPPAAAKEVSDVFLRLSAATTRQDSGTLQVSTTDIKGLSGNQVVNITEDTVQVNTVTSKTRTEGPITILPGNSSTFEVSVPSGTFDGGFVARLRLKTNQGFGTNNAIHPTFVSISYDGEPIVEDTFDRYRKFISPVVEYRHTVEAVFPLVASQNVDSSVEFTVTNISNDFDLDIITGGYVMEVDFIDTGHVHDAKDNDGQGHEDHGPGTYELDNTIATQQSGGSATSVDAFVWINEKSSSNLVAGGNSDDSWSIPTDGKTIPIGVGSGDNEIDQDPSGEAFNVIVEPKSDVFLGGELTIRTGVE